jgi:hypothetical protein
MAKVYGVVVEGYGGAVVQTCGGGVTMVIRTRNSNGTVTKTSNSTCGCRHKFNDANWKDNAKARMVYGTRWSKPNCIFGFFVVYRYKHRCSLDYEISKSHWATWNLIPLDRAKVSDLSMRSWYVDLEGGVRAWRSDYTCEARAPMQSLGQSPGVTDLADARSAWPARDLIPTWNREQVRTNTAIKK